MYKSKPVSIAKMLLKLKCIFFSKIANLGFERIYDAFIYSLIKRNVAGMCNIQLPGCNSYLSTLDYHSDWGHANACLLVVDCKLVDPTKDPQCKYSNSKGLATFVANGDYLITMCLLDVDD